MPLGTRIGQASECFVYWKDTMTNDTWGLNFTCAIDAKQFRECVVSNTNFAFKNSPDIIYPQLLARVEGESLRFLAEDILLAFRAIDHTEFFEIIRSAHFHAIKLPITLVIYFHETLIQESRLGVTTL